MPRPFSARSLPCFTGRLIHDGRFLLLAELGAGAFGKVYEALDTQGEKGHLAVKITHRHLANSEKATLQKREATLHSRVSGLPHVVSFEGTLIEDELFSYMFLQFIDGSDLYKAVVEDHFFYLQEHRIRKAFLQIVDAVHGCHSRGVYHRDLKCENILLSKNREHVYITDFGLATGEKFSASFGCGSAHYMSPEIINEDKLALGYDSPANDVWSLGVILVNMATGRTPWFKAVRSDPCFAKILEDPDFLMSVLPISATFNELVKRIFDMNPVTRITLSPLRDAIESMDHFLLTSEELVYAPPCARAAHTEAKEAAMFRRRPSSGHAVETRVESSSTSGTTCSCSGDAARLITPPSRPVIPVGIYPENEDVPELPDFASPMLLQTPRMQPKPMFIAMQLHDLPSYTGDGWAGLAFERLAIPTRRRVRVVRASSDSDSL